MENETVLGVDPGFAITGYALVQESLNVCDYGVIETHSGEVFGDRLKTLAIELGVIIKEEKPTVVAIEKLFFFKNKKTVIEVSHARGVVMLVAAQYDVPVFEYTPPQVKLAVTSTGDASKKQVQEMVARILGLSQIPKPDDAADALAVALCHLQTLKMV